MIEGPKRGVWNLMREGVVEGPAEGVVEIEVRGA